jgi:hypothetical protein
MDKQQKKRIRIEINNLLDNSCGPCTIAACDKCAVKVHLNKLSTMLDVREPERVEPVEIKKPRKSKLHDIDVYFELFDMGLMNIQVEQMLKVSDRTVVKKRKLWKDARGLRTYEASKKHEHYKQRVDLKHEEFVTLFEQGLGFTKVGKQLNVSRTTAYRHYKRWKEEKENV